jgi:hypothetical protein
MDDVHPPGRIASNDDLSYALAVVRVLTHPYFKLLTGHIQMDCLNNIPSIPDYGVMLN